MEINAIILLVILGSTAVSIFTFLASIVFAIDAARLKKYPPVCSFVLLALAWLITIILEQLFCAFAR